MWLSPVCLLCLVKTLLSTDCVSGLSDNSICEKFQSEFQETAQKLLFSDVKGLFCIICRQNNTKIFVEVSIQHFIKITVGHISSNVFKVLIKYFTH